MIKETIPDFSAIEDVETSKKAFFRFLSPIIASENQKISSQRNKLADLHLKASSGRDLSWFDKRWLNRLADQYGVTTGPDNGSIPWQQLKELEHPQSL